MPQVASSVEHVPHSRIRELAEIAMSMQGVLRLYFGESNLPTPDFIKRAAVDALADGYTFYTENAGLPSLRRAIAKQYAELHNVELDPASEIVITASGVQALNVGIRAVLNPGDEALVLTPAWPNGSSNVAMANAIVREVPHPLCGERYAVDFDALEAALTPRSRLLLYTSPSNPLGWVATDEEQQRLLDFSRRHGLWLLADEVYDRLYYAGGRLGVPVPSILRKATRDDAVMVVQARRLAGGPPRLGAQGHAVERVHHFACGQLCAEGGRDGLGPWRSGADSHVGAPETESRPLPGRP
jgi:aspartate/methionine/tyrosine aminotransferase